MELHQIVRFTLADFTANREFHPAPKTPLFSCNYSITRSISVDKGWIRKIAQECGQEVDPVGKIPTVPCPQGHDGEGGLEEFADVRRKRLVHGDAGGQEKG